MVPGVPSSLLRTPQGLPCFLPVSSAPLGQLPLWGLVTQALKDSCHQDFSSPAVHLLCGTPSCCLGSPWGVLLISSSRRSARAQEAPLAAQPCPPILWGTEPPPLDKARAAQGLPSPAGQPMTHYPRPVLEMHPQESSWAKEGTGWDQSTCGPCGGDSFNESVLTQATHSKGKRPTPEPTAWGPVPSILAEGPSHFPVPPAAGRGCPGAPTG